MIIDQKDEVGSDDVKEEYEDVVLARNRATRGVAPVLKQEDEDEFSTKSQSGIWSRYAEPQGSCLENQEE